jgi:hypothetical protein
MPQQNRRTLKNYFLQGLRPSESNFADLVDSTLNMKDDGFSRSPVNGVEISLVGDQKRLMSFFRARRQDSQTDNPDWAIASDSKQNSVHFVSTSGQGSAAETGQNGRATEVEVLSLTSGGNVGIHVASPAFRLDVDGAVRATGRAGRQGRVPADGEYHDIVPDWLDGCHAFEVMAGTGLAGQKRGRYALVHAFAMNTFNPTGFFFNFLRRKNRIQCQYAWYLSRGDRLKLRWVEEKSANNTDTHRYKLQLKSITDYGYGIEIQYWISELWFDTYMNGSSARTGA